MKYALLLIPIDDDEVRKRVLKEQPRPPVVALIGDGNKWRIRSGPSSAIRFVDFLGAMEQIAAELGIDLAEPT